MEETTFNFSYADEKTVSRAIADGRRLNVEALMFFGSIGSHVLDAAGYLIQNLYVSGSSINMQKLITAITAVARRVEMHRFFYRVATTNLKFYKNEGIHFGSIVPEDDERLIAKGIMTTDFEDSDKDPYQTAGGYRTWKALAGTEVHYILNDDLSVSARFKSNCLIDHYNNNFAGVSTGGGTTRYEIGQRVEERSVKLGREFLDKDWKTSDFKATVTNMDCEKALRVCNCLFPEWIDVLG